MRDYGARGGGSNIVQNYVMSYMDDPYLDSLGLRSFGIVFAIPFAVNI